MSEEQPASETAAEHPATGQPATDSDWFASLDDRTRRYVEANQRERDDLRRENQTYRQQAKAAQEAAEKIQREHESEQQRRDRELESRIRKEFDADLKRQLAEATAEHEQQLAGIRREWLAERVKVRAGGRFADPDDAALYIDITALSAEQDPAKRDQAIDKALDGVLERKPHLAPKDRGLLITQGARSGQPDSGDRERSSWLRGYPSQPR